MAAAAQIHEFPAETAEVTIPRDLAYSMVATLGAAETWVSLYSAGSQTEQGDWLSDKWSEFREALFGDLKGLDADEHDRHPGRVATDALENEYVAQLLEMDDSTLRARRHREFARRMRAAGTTEVPSPFLEQV